MVDGCYLHLLTFSRKQVTGRINGDPFPPFQPSWAEPPSLPPGVCTPPPAKDGSEVGLGKITLQPLIRGQRPHQHLEEDVATILGFSAPLYEVRQLSWRPAQVDQRAPSERFCVSSQENQAGPVQPRRIHGGRYGARVYIRNPCVPFHHSAATPKGDHTSIQIEKKHHPTRSEEEQTVEMICRPNSKKGHHF